MIRRFHPAALHSITATVALCFIPQARAQEKSSPPNEPPRLIEPAGSDSVVDMHGRVGLPASRVDLDRSVLGPMPDEPEPLLRREGDFIIDRAGTVRYDATQGLWLIDFASPLGNGDESVQIESLPTMVLQPNQRLATLQQLIDLAGGFAEARVSGQVQVYRGMNYLLLTAIGGLTNVQEKPIATDPAPTQPPPTATPAPTSPMDLMRSMGQDRDQQVKPRPMETAGAGFVSADISAATRPDDADATPSRREGDLVLQRAGRVVRSDDGRSVLFVLEADGHARQEQPFALMPSRLRATLEDIVTEQGDSVVFIVSGRVYSYQGSDYLLPTTVRVRPSDQNLLR